MGISLANGDIRTKWGAVRVRSKDSQRVLLMVAAELGEMTELKRTEDQEAKTIKGKTDKSDRATLKIIHVFSFG